MESKSRKFCILTTQRSGSTWLRELLDSHPKIRTFGEIFLWRDNHRWSDEYLTSFYDFSHAHSVMRPWSTIQYLDQLNHYPIEYNLIGFKLMYNQLIPKPEIIAKFLADRYKIVHLIRNNYLDTIISIENQKQNGLTHLTNKVKTKSVYLNPDSLLKQCTTQANKVKVARAFLKILPLPVLEISYESLCDNPPQILNTITEFLGVSSSGVEFKSVLTKISSSAYPDKISNYEDVKRLLSESQYASLLD